MVMSTRSLFKNLLNLFLQSPCPLCQSLTTTELCLSCERQLKQSQFAKPAQFWQAQPAVFAWGAYQGRLKQAIAHLKYDNQPEIADSLGQWLAEAWLEAQIGFSKLTVVPIPLHPAKQQQRGYNQAELIAQSFCRLTGYPLQVYGLERQRSTEALFGLSLAQREQSLSEAFSLGKDFQRCQPKSPVLLVDDIYTTGSTVRSAMQTLHRHRIGVSGVAAVAKTEKWSTGSR